MRILLTTDTIGGVWTFTRELSSELLRAGHDVALVSFGRRPSPEQLTWTVSQALELPCRFRYFSSEAPLEWMQMNNTSLPSGANELLRIAEQFCPDVLHSNQFCFGALDLGIPKLVTAHSDVLSWAAACRPNGLEPSPWLGRYCELVRRGLSAADALSAPTRWMADALKAHYKFATPVHVILNGRTLDVSHDIAPPAMKQAVTAGRLWDEAKNISVLLNVLSPWPILIAGDQRHEAAVAPEFISCAKLLGLLSQDSLTALFRASNVYLATSVYEPFGLAPLEAATCGCAVLANDIPSLREVWGDAAIYFYDAESLSTLLLQLDVDEGALVAARRASHERALQLTAKRMAAGYLALYSDLLCGRGRTQSVPLSSRQEFAVHAA